ncbi:hypothetical protein [Nocardia pseudovaccinii]|uniref:hypothetical protein n=1 Tax=Nocardia pseudovaccinii TaxID=189540 RepID=UPI001470DFAA|nr:hypothetical protein [Nocardia pseudovaccinii]
MLGPVRADTLAQAAEMIGGHFQLAAAELMIFGGHAQLHRLAEPLQRESDLVEAFQRAG